MKNKQSKRLLAMAMALTFALSGIIATPATASAAASKTVTVKTQKQLDAALKDKKVTSIVIKTTKNVTLKIKDGDYGKKSLTVASPKATINNYGDFKKISVNDGKSFTDRGEGNNIVVKDTNSLKLVTGKQSSDTKITVSGKGGKISIVNNGDVDAINVKAKSSVTVGGNSKESPTITNNATGSKIVAAQDANVVLNKQAALTVKAGTSLDSLTVKADAKITVSKGAEVKDVVVSGKASDVSLAVNGTVANVTVDTKADVAVSGSTTGTVAITNNAEGATIQSEVKTDVTLNADAKISLDKGAEGSSVTAGNENVKTDVTNNTSEQITVTDSAGKETTVDSGKSQTTTPDDSGNKTEDNKNESTNSGGGGSTGGGDYTGGGSTTTAVSITPTITMTEAGSPATVLKPGVVLHASATNSANADVTYSYSWVCGEECVGREETYQVSKWDSGDTITLWVTAVINGKEVSAFKTTGIVKMVAHQDEQFAPANIPFGVSANNAPNFLKGMIQIADESGYTTGAKITWSSSDYNGNQPGTYTFTGTIALPNENWVWASDDQKTVTVSVTVLEEGALSFSYSKYAPTTADENVTYNQAHMKTSAGTNSYTCYVTANTLKLKKYTFDGEEHQWIGVNVKVKDLPEEAVLQYSKDGSSWTAIGTGIVTATDAADTVTVWLPFDTYKDSYEVVYLRNNVGDSPVSTPVTFSFTEEYLKLTAVTSVSIDPIEAGTYGGTIKNITEMGLPTTLTFTDEEIESHTINITWDIYDGYKEAAGTYVAWVVLDENAPIYLADNVKLPEVKVTVKPVTLNGFSGANATYQAGVEGSAKTVDQLGLPSTLTGTDTSSKNYTVYVDWDVPTNYDTNKAGIYTFAAYANSNSANGNYALPENDPLTTTKVIVKAAAPTVLANTDKTISVDAKSGYEYACAETNSTSDLTWVLLGENSEWNGTFTGLYPAKDYYLFARAAEDEDNLTISASEKVTTDLSTPTAPEKPSLLAETQPNVTEISINAQSGLEYACSTGNQAPAAAESWKSVTEENNYFTFNNLTPGTTYYIFARVPATSSSYVAVSEALVVTTKESAASLVTLTLNETLNADSKYVTDGTLVLKDNATSDYILGPADSAVRARMNCVESAPGFSDTAATGYYIPLYFTTDSNVNVSEIVVTGNNNTKVSISGTGPGYRDLLVRIPGPAQTASFTIDLDGEGQEYQATTYTVDVNSQAGIFPIQLKAADYVSFVYPEGSELEKTDANLLSGKSEITQIVNPEDGSITSIRLQGTPTKDSVVNSPKIDVFIKIANDTSVQGIKASIGQYSTSTDKVTPDDDGKWSTDDWSGQYIKASDGTTFIKLTVSLMQDTYEHGAVWSILVNLYKSNPDGTTYEAKCLPINLDFTGIQPTS